MHLRIPSVADRAAATTAHGAVAVDDFDGHAPADAAALAVFVVLPVCVLCVCVYMC